MCGIFGYWDRERRALDPGRLAAMAATLVHRGPDDEGLRHQPGRGMAIGNRRLAIIDIAGGHQPFVSDDGQVAVVQNGEIFNYRELAAELEAGGVRLRSASDTEVILRLYERDGIACLARLNGMFAIAIDDARSDTLWLARDRLGEKPLFVLEQGARTLFGSEIKALLAATDARPALDLEALHHYLAFNYVPPPWTIWQGVRHVAPGTWLRLTRGGCEAGRWWNLADQRAQDHAFADWSAELLHLLDDATRLRLRADVACGAFLSGGVDSSTIVGLMARHAPSPVKTFAIGFDDPRFDESHWAAQAAARFGCQHTVERVQLDMLARWPQVLHHLDQPHGDASFLPTLRVSELAAREVKVVLTGDGGDELFGGYAKYSDFLVRPEAQHGSEEAFERAYFDAISLFTPAARAALYRPEVARRLDGIDSFEQAARPWLAEAAHLDRINRMLYLDAQLLLPGNNLVKPDRMGMAVSLEARMPMLDWRVVEFAFRSPGATKLFAGDRKHWMKRALAPLVGDALAHRPKQMFTVPVGEWFRTHSDAWLADLLATSGLLRELFRPEAIESLRLAHRDGHANHTRALRALAALALWARGAGL